MAFPRFDHIEISLSETEEQQLDEIIQSYLIDDNTLDSQNELAAFLKDFPINVLIRGCQKSELFADFCRTHHGLKESLSEKLQQTSNHEESTYHPCLEIKSMNGRERYSVFDLYIASVFEYIASGRELSQQRNITTKKALDYACQLGLYDALALRCASLFDRVRQKNMLLESDPVKQHIAQIEKDAKRLSHLYWGIGYVRAGCRLYVLSELFKRAGLTEQALTFRKTALKNILCAASLQDNAYSNEIIDHITGGQGIAPVWDAFLEANHFEPGQSMLTTCRHWELITSDIYQHMEKKAADELAKLERDRAIMQRPIITTFTDAPSSPRTLFQRTPSPLALEEKSTIHNPPILRRNSRNENSE